MTYKYDQENKVLTFDDDNVVHTIKTSSIEFEEFYNKKGQLHRLDGPAVIDYRKRTRSFLSYYRLQEKNIDRGNYPRMEWYKNGKLHRKDGPAIVVFSDKIDGVKLREEWWINGKIKNSDDGPSIIKYNKDDNNQIISCAWVDDKELLHRENGPAVIEYPNSTGKIEKWFKHGQLHRRDGPAVISNNFVCWYYKNEKHRIGGGPTQIQFLNGNQICLSWYKYGTIHRAGNNPSILAFENIDKEYIDQIKTENDVYKLGGKITQIEYHVNGSHHRKDHTKPVEIHGKNIGEENEIISKAKWIKNGKQHREDGPAVINGKRKLWYIDGKLHNLGGPAITDHHPNLNEYYIKGKRVYMKDIRDWMRSNKIDLNTEEGQLAFYMMWGFDS